MNLSFSLYISMISFREKKKKGLIKEIAAFGCKVVIIVYTPHSSKPNGSISTSITHLNFVGKHLRLSARELEKNKYLYLGNRS